MPNPQMPDALRARLRLSEIALYSDEYADRREITDAQLDRAWQELGPLLLELYAWVATHEIAAECCEECAEEAAERDKLLQAAAALGLGSGAPNEGGDNR